MSRNIYHSVLSRLAVDFPLFAESLLNNALSKVCATPSNVTAFQMKQAIEQYVEPTLNKELGVHKGLQELGSGMIWLDAKGKIISSSPVVDRLLTASNKKRLKLCKDITSEIIQTKGRHVKIVTIPLLRAEGSIEGAVCLVSDITLDIELDNEICTTYIRLQDSEQRFRAVFEGANDGILAVDLSTKKFTFANPAACRLLGYSEDEIRKLKVEDIHPKKDLPYVLEQFQKQVKGDIGVAPEIPVLRKNNAVVYCDINTRVIELDGRKLVLGFFRDITERRASEQALKESEESLRDLFENASDLIQSVNAKGKFVYVNRKWMDTLGYSEQDIKGMSLKDILRRDQIKHCMKLFKELSHGKSFDRVEAVFVAKDGREIFVQGNVNGRFKDGKFIASRAIFRDVTEQKKAAQVLKEQMEMLQRFKDATVDQVLRMQSIEKENRQLKRMLNKIALKRGRRQKNEAGDS